MGVPMDAKLNVNQPCFLMAKMANSTLDCVRKCMASTSREVILPLYSTLLSLLRSAVSSLGLPSAQHTWMQWSEASQEPQR